MNIKNKSQITEQQFANVH